MTQTTSNICKVQQSFLQKNLGKKCQVYLQSSICLIGELANITARNIVLKNADGTQVLVYKNQCTTISPTKS